MSFPFSGSCDIDSGCDNVGIISNDNDCVLFHITNECMIQFDSDLNKLFSAETCVIFLEHRKKLQKL
jgi:hypothetical protein